jgi:hypothetical protein
MSDEPDSRGDAHGRSPQDQRPANSVLLEVASLAHSAVRKIKNEDLLGGIALFAIGAVLSAIFFLTRGALSTANCAVGVAFLVAPFGFYILMNWKRRRNKPSPGSPDGIPHTVGLLRDQLLRLSEPELLAFQKRSQLPPFPTAADTNKKKAGHLVDSMPLNMRPGSFIPLLLSIILPSAGLAAYFVFGMQSHLDTPQSRVIKAYYDGINRGLAGDSSGWNDAWNTLSTDRQSYLLTKFPGVYPGKLANLYLDSSHHAIDVLRFLESTSEGERYEVEYTLVETLPRGKLNSLFNDPQSEFTAKQFYALYPDANSLIEGVMDDFSLMFPLPAASEGDTNHLRDQIRGYLGNRNLEQLTSPNLYTEIISRFDVPKPHPALQSKDDYREYEIHEFVYVTVTREPAGWKIKSFVHQSDQYLPSRNRQP